MKKDNEEYVNTAKFRKLRKLYIFALLTIAGYFVMLFGEIFSLHVQTMRGYKREAEDRSKVGNT